jgi:ADP-heptose:LPS heptosyltransferase
MTTGSIAVYTDGEVLGDGVIKLQFAGALKQAFPQARLTWICSGKTVYESILSELAAPLIDDIVHVPADRPGVKDLFAAPLLPDKAFDVLIDSQNKIRRALWVKKRLKHGLFISGAGRFMLSDLKPGFFPPRPRHMLDQVMQLASLAAGKTVFPVPVRIDMRWHDMAAQLLPVHDTGYIGYLPGASVHSKRWPLDRFIALAQTQRARPVFLLGPAEQELAGQIAAALPHALLPLSAGIDDGVPEDMRRSPCMTIALAGRMRAVVANDSGGGHLAAAAQVPMISLIRSNSVRDKFLPVAPRVIGLTPQDHGGLSMADIPLSAVQDALERLHA